MPNIFTLACSLLPGITPQACYVQPNKPAICADAPTGRYQFASLPAGDYTFYCKYGAMQGDAISFPIPTDAPASYWKAKYEACALSDFQKWDKIQQYKKLCGSKCKKLWP